MSTNTELIYNRLGHAVSNMPNLKILPFSQETLDWLAEVEALVEASQQLVHITQLRATMDLLINSNPMYLDKYEQQVYKILKTVLFSLELKLPAGVQGSFIPAGNVHDAMVGVGKVLQMASQYSLIIDPYLDASFLELFAPQAPETVALRLLADAKGHKASLKPAVTTWTKQYQPKRPLEARLAPARSLHDRLILVDGKDAYVLGQSFNHFAERAHTSLVRAGPEVAKEKIAAFEAIWANATPL